jgi:hypothetical protein
MSAVHEPWVRYRETGLYAVPSIHYRQVFAQLVFEACWRKRFDVIAVELPPSLQELGIVDHALSLAPLPGVIIYPGTDKPRMMEVPEDGDPTRKKMVMRPVKPGFMFPLTACDSIVMALRCPQLLAQRWPGWNPEVVLVDDEFREGERQHRKFDFQDDYEVMVDGLAAFQGRMSGAFHASRTLPMDDVRERTMASRLRRLIDEGKEVLFVCGAAHWQSICGYLDAGVHYEPTETPGRQSRRLVLAPLEPAVAWLWGWLDDIPRVGWEMEKACRRGSLEGFDKRAAVEMLVRETFVDALDEEVPTSIRRLEKMERFAETLASAAGRWVPELDDHLVVAAEACVEDRFAELLKEKALEFPVALPAGMEMARVLPHEEGQWTRCFSWSSRRWKGSRVEGGSRSRCRSR